MCNFENIVILVVIKRHVVCIYLEKLFSRNFILFISSNVQCVCYMPVLKKCFLWIEVRNLEISESLNHRYFY